MQHGQNLKIIGEVEKVKQETTQFDPIHIKDTEQTNL